MKNSMQFLAVFTSTINMISFGLAYGWPSPSLPILYSPDSPIKITHDQGSWLTVMSFAGGIAGAPIAAVLADKCGRKPILLITAIPYIASWLIMAFFETFVTLIIARALAGFGGAGLYIVCPSYIAEVSGPDIRGKMGTWLTTMWNLGVLIIFCCGPFLTIKNMAFVALSFPVLFVLTFIWMPETPYFYMLKGKKEEARKVLTKLRNNEHIEEVINEIETELSMTTSLKEICRQPVNRKALFLVAALLTVQEFSGRSPFIFYSQLIFEQADKSIPAAYISIVLAVIQLISSFSASFVVDIFGRKPLLLFSCGGSVLCSIVEGIYFFLKLYLKYDLEFIKWLPVISLLLFIVIFNVGLGIMPVITAGEMLATNVKSNSMCILDLYDSLLIIIVGKFFQLSSDKIGVFAPFWAFALCTALGFFFVIKFLPETKGLSLEEIQKILKS